MRTIQAAKYDEIDLGENICRMIKKLYFADQSWEKCNKAVSEKFTDFKKIMRKFHGFPDWSHNVELLKMVKDYTEQDVMDVFSVADVYLKDEVTKDTKRYGENVTWLPVPLDMPELMQEFKNRMEVERKKREQERADKGRTESRNTMADA